MRINKVALGFKKIRLFICFSAQKIPAFKGEKYFFNLWFFSKLMQLHFVSISNYLISKSYEIIINKYRFEIELIKRRI